MTKEEIEDKLHYLENEYDMKVLFAVESGSRAWGFESLNSDWDVRFIYTNKPQWYFKVESQRDVIEYMYDDIDMAGWELRKALGLLKRSNPSLLEWFNSPIVYYADMVFIERIQNVIPLFYNPVSSMYHYNRMYNKHDECYLKRKDCEMKRFLYYLRGILACKWIDANKTIPPVAFKELVSATVDDDVLHSKIDELVRLKKSGEEHDVSVVDGALMEYARKLADYYNKKVCSFRPKLVEYPSKILDDLLYNMVFACV